MSLAKWTIATASLSLILTAGSNPAWADDALAEIDVDSVAQGDDSLPTEPSRAPNKGVEEITVVGSLIPRTQTDGPNAVDVIDRLEIEQLGVQSPIDLIEKLTYNSGSQFRSDAFRFGGGYGTAQVNLRGLGLGTTLVLVDGRRRTIAGTVANDGSTFVDINTIPLSLIERVEVLKEGAAATYGTDAVAGVINFITRKNVEGAEFSTQYQRSRGGQVEQSLSGIFGWTSGDSRTHLQIHGNYFDSNQLNSTERDFTQALRDGNGRIIRPATSAGVDANFSLAGGPGAFFPIPNSGDPLNGLNPNDVIVPGGPTVRQAADFVNNSLGGNPRGINTIPVIDPGCEQANGSANLTGVAGDGTGFCAIEFVDNFNLNEHEQRAKYNFLVTHDISEAMSASFKFDYTYNKIDDVGLSPSFPPVTAFFIPSFNPGNFTPNNLVQSRSGRPLGENSRTERGFYYTRDMRFEFGLNGDIGDGWRWDVNTGYNQQLRYSNVPDTFQREYQNSLFGFGGSNCAASHVDGLSLANLGQFIASSGIQPGVGDCQFFNPFASATLNPDGVNSRGQSLGNSQDVINNFTGRLKSDVSTSLLYVDGLITGELWELPAGPVGLALGYQYRRDTFEVDRNADQTLVRTPDGRLVNQVTGLETSRFLFLGGGDEVDTEQSVAALFSEVVIPATEKLEIQLAVRFEDYNGSIGSSVDPKLGLRFDATDWLTLRASFSTTFRAPRLNQLGGQATAQENLQSGVLTATGRQDSGFKAVDRIGNSDLSPEEAEVYNFGAILNPFEGFNITADYFRIDFSDAIQAQVAQNLIDREEALAPNRALITAGNQDFCNDPTFQPLMDSSGQNLVVVRNDNCGVARVRAEFINNQSIRLDGVDLGLTWDMDLVGFDAFRFFTNMTHLIQYDIVQDGQTIKAAGSLNDRLFVSSLPKWRVNTGIQASVGDHSGGVTFRYISGYEDDRSTNGGSGRNIGSHNEVDLFYAYDFQQYNATLQAGIFNVLNNEPPFVDLNFNYDTRVVDPRGRRFYTNLTWRF